MELINAHLFLLNPDTLTDTSTNTLLRFQLFKLATNLIRLYDFQG